MKLLIFLCLLTICNLNAQFENKNIFIGYLTTTSKDLISYQLEFDINENNSISGESTTDIYGKNKTKSLIEGTYDPQKKVVSFKEIQNTSTKSSSSKEEFCFIQCQDLIIKEIKGKEILVGKFKGKYLNGESCASGSIYLSSKKQLENEQINFSHIDSVLNNNLEYKTISAKSIISIPWKSKSINFLVWDGSAEDNDIISIYFNNQPVKENVSIKNTKQHIEIPIKNQKGQLKIKAISTGNEGKNTVNLLLIDKNIYYPYISVLEKNEFIQIEIK